MAMSPTEFMGGIPVDGYGPGFFRIQGKVWRGAVVLGAEAGPAIWQGPGDPAPLLALQGQCDLLFLGTGAEIAYAPADLVAALDQAGIRVEAMATPAAARTYNVLLSEGRRVGAALLPV